MNRLLPVSLLILLVLGLGDTAWLAIQFWKMGPLVDGVTSGIWTALAFDFAQGHLYRPIISELGYGGTRYMPIYFMFQGTLIKLGLEPSTAGLVAMQTSAAAMTAGITLILRRSGVSFTWALGLALVTYCTTIFQQYVTDTNCEYLAAALSLFAFACYLPATNPAQQGSRLLLVAILSALAFFVKFTTLYAPAAVLLHLMIARRHRDAAILAGSTLILILVLFGVLQHGSHGYLWENLKSSATGGTELARVFSYLGRFPREMFYEHPAVGITFIVAVVAAISHLRAHGATALFLLFLMTTLNTMVLFVSRGIAGNHVIALHAVSLLMIGVSLHDQVRTRSVAALGFLCMSVVIVATWLPFVPSPRKTLNLPERESKAGLRDAIHRLRPDNRPILSDHGAVSPLLGERTTMLDSYNLGVFIRRDPVVLADLQQRLSRQDFSLLLLIGYIAEGAEGLEATDYVEAARVGRFVILQPRSK